MRGRRFLRRVTIPAMAGLVGGTLACACSTFSEAGTDPTDGSAPDETGGDAVATETGARADGAAADAHAFGCAGIDATICFDFDDVSDPTSGWSTFGYVGTRGPTLTPNGVSAPNAAQFALDAGTDARPSAVLVLDHPTLPTRMQAMVKIATGSSDENGTLISYSLSSPLGGNAVDFAFKCQGTSCAADVTVYTHSGVDAGGSTPIDCGTFVRGEWVSVMLGIDAAPPGGTVICSLDGAVVTTSTPPFGPAGSNAAWMVGVSDDNPLGAFGGQVVYFDDVAFH